MAYTQAGLAERLGGLNHPIDFSLRFCYNIPTGLSRKTGSVLGRTIGKVIDNAILHAV